MVIAFAALGGVGRAQNGPSAAQGQYGKKVTICHKGKETFTVGRAAVPAPLRHGDAIGTCASVHAKKAKAAKTKAAKDKAAKAKAEKAKQAKAEEKSHKPDEGEKPGKGKGRGK